MRAVVFQGPGHVEVVERPNPEVIRDDDALIRVRASGICGSDLHIYHGRVSSEPGFILGHEYVGEVLTAGDAVDSVAIGDRVVGAFATACGTCRHCRMGLHQHCHESRVFGLGSSGGSLQGTQADLALVPRANLTLRRVPDGLSDGAALLAGDVMSTGYHAIVAAGLRPGETCAVIGLGPVGLCATMAARLAGAAAVIAIDTVESRLAAARTLGAISVHAREEDVAARVRAETEGCGAHVAVEAVGSTRALETACQVARKAGTISIIGIHTEPTAIHMGLIFVNGLRIVAGLANVVAHIDPVISLMSAGHLDPNPLLTCHMPLADAADAYEAFDRHLELKILLRP